MTIHTDKQLSIIRDLVAKYPKGPKRLLTKHHYITVREWVDTYRRTAPVVKIADSCRLAPVEWHRFYGYDPVELFRLNLTSEDACVTAAAFAFTGSNKRKRTRLGRVLYERLKPAVKHVYEFGTEGIWRAYWRDADYSSALYTGIYFHSPSREEVESRAMLLAPLVGAKDHWRPTVKFVSLGTPADAARQNANAVKNLTSPLEQEVKNYEQRLVNARANLEKARSIAATMMGAVMLDQAGGGADTSEEAA